SQLLAQANRHMGVYPIAPENSRQRSALSRQLHPHPPRRLRGRGSPTPHRNGARYRISVVAFLTLLAWHAPAISVAQTIGEHAEMERLRVKADEAIANGDPDGAAMNSGKAALMASQLAKRDGENPTGDWYRAAEALFRSQEHGYRALALFQRGGGNPPASTGVCQSLQLAKQESSRAMQRFE